MDELYLPSGPPTPRSRYQAPLRPSSFAPKAAHSAQSSLDSLATPDIPLSILPLPFHLYPTLLPSSKLSLQEKQELFCTNYLRAASTDSADMLEWLLAIPEVIDSPRLGHQRANSRAQALKYSTASLNSTKILQNLPDNVPRKYVDLEYRDQDGNSALILAVALGHAESVRVLVEAGVDIDGTDKAGWTSLHWSVQNGDIPLTAYLLNHRASSITSHRGLQPKDLVKRGKEGSAMKDILKSSEEAAAERDRLETRLSNHLNESSDQLSTVSNGKGKMREDSRPDSRNSSNAASVLSSTSMNRSTGWTRVDDEEAKERALLARMELAMETGNLDVDISLLGLGGGMIDDEEGIENPFIWDRCLPDQMVVFSMEELPVIFDVIITQMKTVATRAERVIPANVIFLCARYAFYHSTTELLEELFLGAMERIEAAIHEKSDDITNCSFWLSNSLLLLYYLRKEPNLFAATEEYQIHLCDLINEIDVYLLRLVERRIDRNLEPAILEHEALPGFEEVDFEGDWTSSRLKKMIGRGRKSMTISKSVSTKSIFNLAESTGPGGNSIPRTASMISIGTAKAESQPSSITSLLSSTLFILQLYEIPPLFIAQAYSQLFYWISCEIFNRLLTQKKYLSRSKAMQIRNNASVLEDWVTRNFLPAKINIHFAPLNQLLQWIQCLSSEDSIDGLIGTVQLLRSINPLQLNRAVREYRYEMKESKMSPDCVLYLQGIQTQWEALRMSKLEKDKPENAFRRSQSSVSSAGELVDPVTEAARVVEKAFGGERSLYNSYVPPSGPEVLGELLNSRHMLPFVVPPNSDLLLFNAPDVFGPFSLGSLSNSTSPQSTPMLNMRSNSSIDSIYFSSTIYSTQPSTTEAQPEDSRFVPIVPEQFWVTLDQARLEVFRNKKRFESPTVGSKGASTFVAKDWSNWREELEEEEESLRLQHLSV